MRRWRVGAFALATVMMLRASSASAQTTAASDEGFAAGYADVGGVIGFGGLDGASASVGARIEYGFKALEGFGGGILSVAGGVDYYSANQFCSGCGFTYTPVGGTLNYHVHLYNRRVDPFVGAGFGDAILNFPAACVACGSLDAGLYGIAHAGLRYFLTPSLALYGDVGTGPGKVHVGITYKIAGP